MKLYDAFKTNKEFRLLKLLYFVVLKNKVLLDGFKLKIYFYYELLL